MKKILFLLALLLLPLASVKAQKIALVDMEFILKKDPSYAVMNRQIEDLSKKWQAEVSGYEKKAEEAYKAYQSEAAFLSAQQKKQREEAIVALEKQGYELKRKYFGPEGDLFKKREALMKPIQDRVWAALRSWHAVAVFSSSSTALPRRSSTLILPWTSANPSSLSSVLTANNRQIKLIKRNKQRQ